MYTYLLLVCLAEKVCPSDDRLGMIRFGEEHKIAHKRFNLKNSNMLPWVDDLRGLQCNLDKIDLEQL